MKPDWNEIVERTTDHAIIGISEDGEIISFSHGAEMILGWSREEIVGQSFEALFTAPDRKSDRARRELDVAREEGLSEDSRWHLRADGTSVYLNGTTRWLPDQRIFVKIARDVTRHPKTERRTEAFLEATSLIAKADDPDEALGRVFAQLGEDLLWDVAMLWQLDRKTLHWIRPELNAPDLIEELASTQLEQPPLSDCLEDPGVNWTTDIDGSSDFGEALRKLDVRTMLLVPFRSETRPVGVIGFFTRELRTPDRHIVKMMTSMGGLIERLFERSKTLELLRSSLTMRDELMASVSHDLRTPLTTIRGWIGMIEGTDEETRREAAASIGVAVQQQEELLEDLLAAAKSANNALEIRNEAVDLSKFIAELVETARIQIEEKKIDLALSFPETSRRVEVDPRRVRQILWNLLSNAIKFTRPGGKISIEVWQSTESTSISISDTGIGMSAEELERAFSRFWTRDGRGKGTGLGLHVVRSLAEAHGGSVQAHSDGPGKGSTFVVELPNRAD